MTLRQTILKLLPKPNYRSKLINGWQNTDDIVKAIQQQHIENLQAADKIKHLFCDKDERTTARNIFDFLKSEIEYKVEPASKQTTKTLQRFVADGGDCKHFALFANTILQQCGFKGIYRFAGYRDRRNLQHVYTYLPKSNTVLDAVLPSFDTEKPYTTKKDINMSLYKLSGVDNEIGKISFDQIKSNLKTATAKSSNVVKKAAAQIPNAAAKLAQGSKTVSLTIPRAAFRGLVALNVHGLATNLKKVTDKKGTMDGLGWWYDFGGDRNELQKTINESAGKKKIFGIEEENAAAREVYGGYSGEVRIGEPVTVAASLASAAPILIKVLDVLKKAGINVDDVQKIADVTKKASADFENVTGEKLTNVIFKKDTGAKTEVKKLSSNDLKPTTTQDAEKVVTAAVAQSTGVDPQVIKEIKETVAIDTPITAAPDAPTPMKNLFGGIDNKMLLLGGGALLLAFFVFKRR
jgi:hypothetical protein